MPLIYNGKEIKPSPNGVIYNGNPVYRIYYGPTIVYDVQPTDFGWATSWYFGQATGYVESTWGYGPWTMPALPYDVNVSVSATTIYWSGVEGDDNGNTIYLNNVRRNSMMLPAGTSLTVSVVKGSAVHNGSISVRATRI